MSQPWPESPNPDYYETPICEILEDTISNGQVLKSWRVLDKLTKNERSGQELVDKKEPTI